MNISRQPKNIYWLTSEGIFSDLHCQPISLSGNVAKKDQLEVEIADKRAAAKQNSVGFSAVTAKMFCPVECRIGTLDNGVDIVRCCAQGSSKTCGPFANL